MKLRSLEKLFLFMVTISISFVANCSALNSQNFYIKSNNTSPVYGEEFSIVLNVEPSEDLNVSVFRLKLEFDPNKLKYTGLYSENGSNDFKTHLNNNVLTIIFLTSEKGLKIKNDQISTLLEVNFRALSVEEDTSTEIYAKIDGIAGYNLEKITPHSENLKTKITISEKPKVNCNLKSLTAENYTLYPNFSENVTSYNVTVPSGKSNLTIKAEPQDPDAKVTINKTVLNSAGKTTALTATVLGSDSKSKKTYKVTVKRLKAADNNTSKKDSNKKSKETQSANKYEEKSNSVKKSEIKDTFTEGNTTNSRSPKNSTIIILQNHFNFPFFLGVTALCAVLGLFILKAKIKENNSKSSVSDIPKKDLKIDCE